VPRFTLDIYYSIRIFFKQRNMMDRISTRSKFLSGSSNGLKSLDETAFIYHALRALKFQPSRLPWFFRSSPG